MATYYIDPVSGSGDGSSSLNPAATFPSPLVDGTTYAIKAGTTIDMGASGLGLTSKSDITIGSYNTGQATITANSGTIVAAIGTAGTNITFQDLILDSRGGANTMALNGDTTGLVINNVEFKQPVGSAYNLLNFNAAREHSTLTIQDIVLTNGSAGIAALLSKANATMSDWTIDGVTARGLTNYPIRITIESTNDAWLTTVINNIILRNVDIDECYGGVWLRFGQANATDPFATIVWADNALIENIVCHNGANYLSNTLTSGLHLFGLKNSTVRNFEGVNCTTAGGSLQTLSSKNTVYEDCYVEHSVSINGIDAVGIFCDAGNLECTFRHNTIYDCPGYDIAGGLLAVANAGSGIGIWRCKDNKIYGNIIKDTRYGFSYGHADGTGNQVFNNVDVGCTDASLKKHGTSALAGNILQKNNLSIGSATLLSASGTSYCTQVTNQLYATAGDAGVILDSNGIPIALRSDSPARKSGTDMDAAYQDADGNLFQSPPNVGAFQDISTSNASSFLGRVFA